MGDQATRLVLAAVVVAALVGATLAANLTGNVATESALAAAPSIPPAAGVSALAAGNVSSSAWYCTAAAPPTLVLSSLSDSVVRATVTWVRGKATTVYVPPGGLVDVPPPAHVTGPQGASVLLDGGDVAVAESVRDANGWSVAECASAVSSTWYFPQGSTVAGDTVTLDLYDPSVTPAVVDVDVLTPSGETDPAAYQGVSVPAGGLVTEELDSHATSDPVLGTVIEAASGSVVAEELDVTTADGRRGLSEQLGSPVTQRVWAFPYTVEPRGGSVSLNVINPGSATCSLVLDATYGAGIAVHPVTVSVKGQSVSSIVLGSHPGFAAMTPYSIVVRASSGVVVGRAIYAPKKTVRPSAGYTFGVAVGADRWLVPGVGPHGRALSLAIEALGSKPLHVTVTRSGRSASVPGSRDSAVVVPGEEVHVDPRSLAAYSGPLVVVADGPVAVELDVGPAGSVGIVVVPAFVVL